MARRKHNRKPIKRPVIRNPIGLLSQGQQRGPAISRLKPIEATQSDKPYYDYNTGTAYYKGMGLSRSEIKVLKQFLTDTPVSHGRFPTEADLILSSYRQQMASTGNTYVPPSLQHIVDERLEEEFANNPQMAQWKSNLMKAVEEMVSITDSDTAETWGKILEALGDMDTGDFLRLMDRYGDEISITFRYQLATTDGFAERVLSLISKVV